MAKPFRNASDILLISIGGRLLHAFMIPPRKTGTYLTSTSLNTVDVLVQDTAGYQHMEEGPQIFDS